MSKVLITGGCGFIGSHVALFLLEHGYEVRILDSNLNSSSKVINKIFDILNLKKIYPENKFKSYKGDVRDEKILENIFLESFQEGSIIQSVIHLSGLKSVRESKISTLNYWDVNIAGTITLLKVMDKYNCRKLIFSSSASIYGDSKNVPFCEETPPKTLNPYANTKLTAEIFFEDLCSSKGKNWNIISLRYFNPIGAHSTGLIGEEPLLENSNIFPLILKSCIDQNKKIYIYGRDWPTHDGTCIRDYIHIEDLAEGHVVALKRVLSDHKGFIRINLGTGKGTSVLELLKVFEKVNNIKLEYEFIARRDGDCPILVADNSKALNYLGWAPKRGLEEMCLDGYNWLKINQKVYFC